VIDFYRSQHLRLTSLPTHSEEGRAAERYRLAGLGAAATAASRLAGAGLIVLTVHWAAPTLSPERFGIWATFSGLMLSSSFLDLGIGNALVNHVAHASARGDASQIRTVVMGGLGWLACIGIGASLVLTLAAAYLPWLEFLKLQNVGAVAEARNAALIFSALFGLNIIANGSLKILVGQQKSHEANVIGTMAALLACPITWFVIRAGGRVGSILLAGFCTQSAVTLASVLVLISRRRMLDLQIGLRSMIEQRRQLLSSGTLFFLLQVGTTIGWGADTLILAGVAGASEVAALAVAQRLYLFASQPVAILIGPLWAAYADAHARGDNAFIHRTLRASFGPSIVTGTAIGAVLLLAGPRLVAYWTKEAVQIPGSLLIAFTIWMPFECGGIAWGTYLNGTGVVREQVLITTCFCMVVLPAKIWAAAEFGATGLVIATVMVYALIVAGGYALLYRRRIMARHELF